MTDELSSRLDRLSPAKRALLERLLLGRLRASTPSDGIPPRDPSRPCPLSPLQERIWFLEQLHPRMPVYHEPSAARLRGPLDFKALTAALDAILARHEILRLAIRLVDGVPTQVFHPSWPGIAVVDLSDRAGEERESAISDALREEATRPFDLQSDPPLRAMVLRLGEADHVLALTLHHLVCDRPSLGVLFRELEQLYTAAVEGTPVRLPPLPLQFGDVAAWQRARAEDASLEADVAYWTAQLRSAPTVLDLPADRPRSLEMSHRGAIRVVRIGASVSERLQQMSRAEGVTLFTVLLAAFATLLSRYTGREDIVLGVPITSRDRPELEPLIGPLVGSLPLRLDLSRAPSFRDLLGRVRVVVADAHAHRGMPFERLVDLLQPKRALGHTPGFQVMLAWREPADLMAALRLPGLSMSPIDVDRGASKFDLTLFPTEVAGEIVCEVEYATDLFDVGTIDRMLGHFRVLLEGVAWNPGERLARLSLLTAAERHRLLTEWNDTTTDYPRDVSIPALVRDQCRRAPHAIAVEHGDERLTYRELTERAARLAGRLKRHGVRAEEVVGICLERSVEMVVGLLGILQAGGAYLPLDPRDPPDRLAFLVRDAGAPLILTRSSWRARLAACGARLLCLDEADAPPVPDDSVGDAGAAAGGDRLAYVVYTSGSTGEPKGVEITHRAVVRLLVGVDYVRLGPDEKILQLGPLGFDASTFEVWAALLHGGCCVLYPERVPSAERLGQIVERHGVTTLFLTTALFNHVVDELPPGLAGARQLLTGGETVSVEHVARAVAGLPGTQIIHCYGPTEATTFTTCYPVPRALAATASTVPIGRPIANSRVYILDRHGEPVPVGVPGEIHIGGDGLARGYRGRPELTDQRFGPDPFRGAGGGRLYRTGDLARYRPDGVIEFVGRMDDQVKLRGFRIEPAEIEAALASHPGVARSVVTVRLEGPRDDRLVAYVVPGSTPAPDAAELRAHLATILPAHMIPSAFVPIVGLPLTPNGKVDRAALPPPGPNPGGAGARDLPRTPVEELIAGIWADALNVQSVGRHEDFFELGGHSLLAAQAMARLCQVVELDLPVRVLFEAPTVAQMGARVNGLRVAGASAAPMRLGQRVGLLPLAPQQERIWRHCQTPTSVGYLLTRAFEQIRHHCRTGTGARYLLTRAFEQIRRHFGTPTSAGYTLTRAFQVSGALDVGALERSLAEMVRRHEILRTTYVLVEGEPWQVIGPPDAPPVAVLDLRGRPHDVERITRGDTTRTLDLARGPLLRAVVLRLAETEYRLLLVMHHITYDAESTEIFFRELRLLYGGFASGTSPRLAGPGLQYADYAAWQRQRMRLDGDGHRRQLADWMDRLGGLGRSYLELPFRRRRSGAATLEEAEQAIPFTDDLRDRVEALSRRERVTPFMTMLAAFEVLLFHYTGRGDLLIGTYASNRGREEFGAVMGCFVNILPLRVQLHGGLSFREVLHRVRAEVLGAFASPDVTYEEIVAALQAAGKPAPRVDVIFHSVRRRPDAWLTLPGLDVRPLVFPRPYMPWGLSLLVDERLGRLACSFDARRYDPAGARRMLSRFTTVLERVAVDPRLGVSDLDEVGPLGARGPRTG